MKRTTVLWIGAACAALVLILALPWGLRGGGAAPVAGNGLGVEFLSVELLAGGDLARLDYRVVDYEKAKRALAPGVPLGLIAEGMERPLPILQAGRLGALRQRPSRTGKDQYVLFRNSGRALRRGTVATIAVGEARITGVPVS